MDDISQSTASLTRAAQQSERMRRVTEPAVRLRKRMQRRRDGEQILRDRYREVTGRELDLDAPTTFIDKLYWRMITQQRRPDPRFTELTDKYRVRRFVRSVLGEDYLIPLYWSGTDPAKIPFDALPARYVVKSNHASSHVVRVSGEINRDQLIAEASSWLGVNYYWMWREEQYYRIRPRILVEEYLDDGVAHGPLDYRYYCFSGEPAFIRVSDHVLGLKAFLDLDWNPLDIRFRSEGTTNEVPRPVNLAEMTQAAIELSQTFDFVRVDLYNIHGRVRFGELTFTPGAGGRVFEPDAVNVDLGRRWQLVR